MGRKRFKLTSPVPREHSVQAQVAHLLAIEIAPPGVASLHGVLWWSVDHANAAGLPHLRTRRGVIAGLADIYVEHQGRAHHIELKTATGRVSAEQRTLGSHINDTGGRWAIARDGNDVLRLLDQWGVPRHRRTTLS